MNLCTHENHRCAMNTIKSMNMVNAVAAATIVIVDTDVVVLEVLALLYQLLSIIFTSSIYLYLCAQAGNVTKACKRFSTLCAVS